MGKSGYVDTKLKNKQIIILWQPFLVLWRHNLSSIIYFLLHNCLRWNKSIHCFVHLHCLFLVV